ncbi:FUSC family protein [Pseudooceanicola sp. LIPI14-2-Ac024]|uniref:FUSC family protein n=1 Tax=Pseudooceanicola sp. LIPI14-2-Ac024 TaxID=3344875 RepID=UPI0035CF257A
MKGVLPWKLIGIIGAGAVPALVFALLVGGNPALALIGFIAGLLACLGADRRWALAAPVISVAAYLLMPILPLPEGWAIYVIALAFVALVVAGRHIGAAAALGQAAFGWIFLAMAPVAMISGWGLVANVVGGICGAGVAIAVGLESFRRTPATTTTANDATAVVAFGTGFLLSIAAAQSALLDHGYWIPFVFLQVAMAANTHHPVIAMQRIAGAVIGIFAASLIGQYLDLPLLRIAAILACVVFGLRYLAVWPILSRALMTGAVVFMLTRPGEVGAAETRLLAEVLGVLTVLVASGLYVALSYFGTRNRADDPGAPQ